MQAFLSPDDERILKPKQHGNIGEHWKRRTYNNLCSSWRSLILSLLNPHRRMFFPRCKPQVSIGLDPCTHIWSHPFLPLDIHQSAVGNLCSSAPKIRPKVTMTYQSGITSPLSHRTLRNITPVLSNSVYLPTWKSCCRPRSTTMTKCHWGFCHRSILSSLVNARLDGGLATHIVQHAFWIWSGSFMNGMTSQWSAYRRRCKMWKRLFTRVN